jgi:hypothetical protein
MAENRRSPSVCSAAVAGLKGVRESIFVAPNDITTFVVTSSERGEPVTSAVV